MAAGAFDREILAPAWFDATEYALAWFDWELIAPPATSSSGSATESPLVASVLVNSPLVKGAQ